eukprot:gnl/MRDRNA2_/MRDRNA2_84043_c0_seq1.p1 gnl/MRDRNA2_/MRDRNA2_84043_c0~~gnl/MRDRNA2_/MRDRNA2_84043_c0_seq1.p1  ORF type:complete len:547 (+),score=97.55 gnl/MRDRNA2_/MRDRNA2_84043_c0_seq1:193-1641(+)
MKQDDFHRPQWPLTRQPAMRRKAMVRRQGNISSVAEIEYQDILSRLDWPSYICPETMSPDAQYDLVALGGPRPETCDGKALEKAGNIPSGVLTSCLGAGTFGIVLKTRKKDTKELQALKLIRVDEDVDLDDLENEILIGSYDIPFALPPRDVFTQPIAPQPQKKKKTWSMWPKKKSKASKSEETEEPQAQARGQLSSLFPDTENVFMFYDMMKGSDGIDLANAIDEQRQADIKARHILGVAAQMAFAIYSMHQNGLIHRDIKLDHLMLPEQYDRTNVPQIVLIDFGLMLKCGTANRACTDDTVCGTPDYVAPSVACQSGYSKCPRYSLEVDWWSFGVTLFTFRQGGMPFGGDTEPELFAKIQKGLSYDSFPENILNSKIFNTWGSDEVREAMLVDISNIAKHPVMGNEWWLRDKTLNEEILGLGSQPTLPDFWKAVAKKWGNRASAAASLPAQGPSGESLEACEGVKPLNGKILCRACQTAP